MAKLLEVKVQPRSKKPGVEKLADGTYRVRVLAAPERGRANREVLERLAEPDRQILILCELEELSAEAASKLLGITQNNARVRLHRARARFTLAYEKFADTHRRERP